MSNKLKPALLVGGALGVLLVLTVIISAVPILRMAGCCNCLWPVVAGALGTMLYVKGSPTPATIADGVIVGALVGIIGGLIYLVIGLPINYFVNGVEAIDAQMRQINPQFPLSGAVLFVVGGFVGFVFFVVLSLIGGLIGVPIFEKRKPGAEPPPPAPPSNFGAGPGSFGSGQ
jgi:hypothetical protein